MYFKGFSPYIRKAAGYAAGYAGKKAMGYALRKVSQRFKKKRFGKAQGFYQGPFKKPTGKGVQKPVIDTMCLTKGYQKTSEIYGLVNDPKTCYVLHSTWHREYYAKTIIGALIRKLFKVSGMDISSPTAPICIAATLSPTVAQFNYVIVFQKQHPDTADITSYVYEVEDKSLEGVIAGFTDMYNYFAGYLGLSVVEEPWKLSLCLKDVEDTSPALTTAYREIAKLDLTCEHLVMHIASSLKVQNRTLGALADNEEAADRVDAQPLKGYLYSFKNCDPRLKFLPPQDTTAPFRLNRIPETGVQLIRAAQMEDNFKDPPVPKTFANISGASYVSLEPGAIKKSYITYEFKGKLVNVMKQMRPSASGTYPGGGSPESGFSGVRGRATLIALEERISTGSSNKVTLSYERELKVGCYFKTKKQLTMLTTFATGAVNNTT